MNPSNPSTGNGDILQFTDSNGNAHAVAPLDHTHSLSEISDLAGIAALSNGQLTFTMGEQGRFFISNGDTSVATSSSGVSIENEDQTLLLDVESIAKLNSVIGGKSPIVTYLYDGATHLTLDVASLNLEAGEMKTVLIRNTAEDRVGSMAFFTCSDETLTLKITNIYINAGYSKSFGIFRDNYNNIAVFQGSIQFAN